MESFENRVIKAITEKMGTDVRCPLCRVSDWAVQPGIYRFKQHVRTESLESYGDALPSAALVCKNCGNTHFLNLIAYGDTFKEDI
jgi:hypothetical protein